MTIAEIVAAYNAGQAAQRALLTDLYRALAARKHYRRVQFTGPTSGAQWRLWSNRWQRVEDQELPALLDEAHPDISEVAQGDA